MKVDNNQVKATFRIPYDLIRELKHKAVDENISVNALVVKALKDFVNTRKK